MPNIVQENRAECMWNVGPKTTLHIVYHKHMYTYAKICVGSKYLSEDLKNKIVLNKL